MFLLGMGYWILFVDGLVENFKVGVVADDSEHCSEFG